MNSTAQVVSVCLLCLAAFLDYLLLRTFGVTLTCMEAENTTSWSSMEESHALAGFEWGCTGTMPLVALVMTRFHGEYILCGGLLLVGAGLTLLPLMYQVLGSTGVILVRILMGVAFAVTTPAIDHAVSLVAPQRYTTVVYSFVTCSMFVSGLIGNAAIGALCEYQHWDIFFHSMAVLCVLTSACWYLLVKRHILTSASLRRNAKLELHDFVEQVVWKPAFYSMIACGTAGTLCVSLYVYYMPLYYFYIHKLPIDKNGIVTSLCFAANIVGGLLFTGLSQLVKVKTPSISLFLLRALSIVALMGCPSLILYACFLSSGRTVVMTVIVCGAFLYSACFGGYRATYVTLHPRFTGIISSILNLVCFVGNMLLPYLYASIVQSKTPKNFQIFFSTVLCFGSCAAVSFVLVGRYTIAKTETASLSMTVYRIENTGDDEKKETHLTEKQS